MSVPVLVRGDGVAAACCALFLATNDSHVSVVMTGRPKLSAVLLSEATQTLLMNLFADRTLFQGLPRISKRVVAWGPKSQPIVLPHSALVISEQSLLERLWARVQQTTEEARNTPVWEIISSSIEAPARDEKRFGSRIAFVGHVRLKASADRAACWVESLDAGWLFLFPLDAAHACLIAVGGPATSLIVQSRLIAAQVETPIVSTGEFPAYPRILSELSGSGWLACGTAAMAFDPLCGEGVANAAREAILACAVVRAALRGCDVDSLLIHYNSRLLQGFLRHLQVCEHFYTTGGAGPFWSAEVQLLRQGIGWLRERLNAQPAPRYRLAGFELLPIS